MSESEQDELLKLGYTLIEAIHSLTLAIREQTEAMTDEPSGDGYLSDADQSTLS